MSASIPIVPPSHWLMKNFNKLADNPLDFMSWSNKEYGGLVNLNISPWVDVILVANPELVKYFLIDNQKNYKKSFAYKFLRYALGNGLLTNEGDSWLQQRRIAQPAFHRERLSALASGMVKPVENMLSKWEEYAKQRSTVDIASEFMKLTTEIAAAAMFSTNLGHLKDEITNNINIVNQFVMDKVSTPFRIPMWFPTSSNHLFKKALRKLDEIIYELIENRRKSKEIRNDLLSMLMEAQDDDRQLRDELMTLFLAGSETSSNALAWTSYLLSRHPEVREQMYSEIRKEIGESAPTADNILKLKYTSMVINESMRLYPPAWVIGREAINPDSLNGVKIKKRSQIYISTYVIHRDPRNFQNPEQFDPLRFSPDIIKGRPKFSYLPFGAGPRLCIGNNFAVMEITIALVKIAQRNIKFELETDIIETEPLVTLRPKNGIKAKINV
jgi:cytochrome P450